MISADLRRIYAIFLSGLSHSVAYRWDMDKLEIRVASAPAGTRADVKFVRVQYVNTTHVARRSFLELGP
jgi:hypothetical protein